MEQALPDSPEISSYLNNLGIGLGYRYDQTGELADLERMVEVYEQAVEKTLPGSPDLPSRLNNLGNGLSGRYARMGTLADLARAIDAYEQAVEQTPPGSPELSRYLNSLGTGLSRRYARTEDLADLVRVIEAYEQAVKQTPSGSPDLPGYLNNLGTGLKNRYVRTGELADLSRAIEVLEQAVKQTPQVSPALPFRLNNLGNGLSERYAQTRDSPEGLADLARAIEVYQQAVEQSPPGSPGLPMYLNNLGNGLSDRYARMGKLADLTQAIEAYEAACQKGQDTTSEEALRAAHNWGGWASEREEWVEAGRAYGYGMVAIEQLYRVQLTRRAKETWLRSGRGLSARASYALARANDQTNAVLALERDRARLLAEVLERDHADLIALEQTHPIHCADYRRAADRIFALSGQELHPSEMPPDFDLVEAMRAARAELDTAAEVIRFLPGYADFLDTPGWEDIAGTATSGQPLVYLAVTPAGTVVLIVTPTTIHPVYCDLTEDVLREHTYGPDDDPELGGYLGTYDQWRESPRDPIVHATWLNALDHTTQWLWDTLMGPIVRTLNSLNIDHATLIPQGFLGLLPLHAAWTETRSGCRLCALDYLTLTYAPNARALSAARATAARVPPDRIFAIDEPQPVSATPLPNSNAEVSAACEHFVHRKVLGGNSATEQAVRDQLPHHTVLHFSCHGFAAPTQPLNSGLLMAHDEILTLRDILALRLENARLAVLSACETGIPGTELPDEVISLSTGLAQAGLAGVVASLWSVSDLSTMMLMTRFYELWKRDGLEPPDALRQAQLWIRDTTNAQKADYFKGFLPSFLPASDTSRLPAHIADALYKHTRLARPDENDFEHPFYWGAFTYTGV